MRSNLSMESISNFAISKAEGVDGGISDVGSEAGGSFAISKEQGRDEWNCHFRRCGEGRKGISIFVGRG